MGKHIRVIELFAGVGGFRLGLEDASDRFKVVWSNQWEPSSKNQQASEIYVERFGAKGHTNENIAEVKLKNVPEHDMLVGGFPCQDYSVARTLNGSSGIEGKKGVLWWEIHRILKGQKKRPSFLLLENVDRLLKSPAKQRGRDMAIILSSLAGLGYAAEWRVINAADYGMPQRRRRVFLLGYHKSHPAYEKLKNDAKGWVVKEGVLAKAFPLFQEAPWSELKVEADLVALTERFNSEGANSASPFENAGMMVGRKVITSKVSPNYDGKCTTIRDIMLLNGSVPDEYYIPKKDLKKWEYLKGGKSESRVNKGSGLKYTYSEGPMAFPDPVEKPARTIITGEGGRAPSRFKHVIQHTDGRLRRLTPLELERLNMFPDDHTEGATDNRRAFFMGNALVVGVVERIGKELVKAFSK